MHWTALALAETSTLATILLGLALILGLALLGRWGASRLKQPSVLGEIAIGILLGNVGVALGMPVVVLLSQMDEVIPILDTMLQEDVSLSVASRQMLTLASPEREPAARQITELLNGPDGSKLLTLGQATRLFSDLGVVLLMFMTGLKATVGDLKAAGGPALRVSVVGALVPVTLAAATSYFLRPEATLLSHLFLGVLFGDTTLGLTARIFADADMDQSREARVVLGAGVIDQVVVLVLIAVMTTLATSPDPDLMQVAPVLGLALAYVGLLTMYGEGTVRFLVPIFDAFDFQFGRFIFAMSLVFVLAWLASAAGINAVMGGFAAGLILNEARLPGTAERPSVREMSRSVEALFSPVFFVLVGMQVDLAAFGDPTALLLAGALVLAGLGGKLLAGLAAGQGVSSRVVGLAMMPRGGTMLIYAGIGRTFGLVDDKIFAALAIFVITSMLLTGVGLQRALASMKATATTS